MIGSPKVVAYFKKADEDIQEALILLKGGFPDGTCNRAYYSLFHCLIALLYTTDSVLPKTHAGVHTEFRKRFIKTGLFPELYSNVISELFNLRQGGDYEIEFNISIEDAQEAVKQDLQFKDEVQFYLQTNGFIS